MATVDAATEAALLVPKLRAGRISGQVRRR